MNDNFDPNATVQAKREALLESGAIVEYDVMSTDKYAFNELFYRYLGCGTIYKINGRAGNDRGRKHFWCKRNRGD